MIVANAAERMRIATRLRQLPRALLARPALPAGAALLVLSGLAWLLLAGWAPGLPAGTVYAGAPMAHAGHAALQLGLHAWTVQYAALALLMWLLMAMAMMLPAAAPAILSFADIAARDGHAARAAARVGAFLCAYLAVWWGFGLLATATQWGLAAAAQRLPAARGDSPVLAAALLLLAGAYQFSALKQHCLDRCRSPLAFFLAHWREGIGGAGRLGFRHGLHCLGCCWALMALMLPAAAMNLGWTALLATLMLGEKVLPGGARVARVVGIGLLLWGGALLVVHLK